MTDAYPPRRCKYEVFNDHFQNYRRYGLPKAQLVIADIPYNVGKNAYGSNPSWYIGGEIRNGQSKLAGAQFFDTDEIAFRLTLRLDGQPEDAAPIKLRDGTNTVSPFVVLQAR